MPPSTPSAEDLVREFWRLMATNDFHAVKAVLSDELVVDWPQSGERIRGPEHFARVNAEYPTKGRWHFRLNELAADHDRVVTQVSLGDGEQSAEPVSFFTVAGGRIVRIVEYWPEPFAPAANRRHLVESSAPTPGRPPPPPAQAEAAHDADNHAAGTEVAAASDRAHGPALRRHPGPAPGQDPGSGSGSNPGSGPARSREGDPAS